MSSDNQLELFDVPGVNVIGDVKRYIRIELFNTKLSRDQVVDEMNRVAERDGIRKCFSKAILDSWCKESDPSRIPDIASLIIFCRALGTLNPLRPLVRSLNGDVIGSDDARVLAWGRAELERRKASKRARLALEQLDA